MGWFNGAAPSLGKRIAKSIVEGIIGGVVSSGLGIVFGLVAGNLLYGLVIGVVVGMVILVVFAVRAIQIATSVPQQTDDSNSDRAAEQEPTPKAALPPNPFPPIEDHEVANRYFERRTVYIADFVRKLSEFDPDSIDPLLGAPTIIRRTFKDCRIYGPAVLVVMPLGGKLRDILRGSSYWNAGRHFWVPQGTRYSGVILLRDCVFEDCRFANVGVLQERIGEDSTD